MTSLLRVSSLAAASAALLFAGGVAAAAPPGDVPFGVYDPYGDFSDDPEVEIEHLFLPWEDLLLSSLVDADQYALDRDRALLVTIEPWTWSRDERNTAEYLKQGIAEGLYDPNMRVICAVLGSMRSPVTVRWGHEMDDYSGQFIWAGWTPDEYISAYRRMIDICRSEAPDVQYMWSPLGYDYMNEYYPGSDYVDVIGLSVFGLQPWEKAILGGEQTFVDILTPRYERAVQFDKPVVVAELGYVGDEDYVEMWENDVRVEYPRFPRLSGVVYFNQREVYPWPDGFGLPDWRIGSNVIDSTE
jgi:endoglucanase